MTYIYIKKSILSAFLARVKLIKQNIGRGEFSQFPNLSQTNCQEDDVSTYVSTYVRHLNALYSDFESRFEDILTMELTELNTDEELKVQFKNGYQQCWLQNNIPVTYPVLWNIARKFFIYLSIVIPSGKGVQRCYQSPNEKKKQTGHH
nr:unnamed protein product [Callosobruchus chinensis]